MIVLFVILLILSLTIYLVMGGIHKPDDTDSIKIERGVGSSVTNKSVSETLIDQYICDLLHLRMTVQLLHSEGPSILKMADRMLPFAIREMTDKKNRILSSSVDERACLWKYKGPLVENISSEILVLIDQVSANSALGKSIKEKLVEVSLICNEGLLENDVFIKCA